MRFSSGTSHTVHCLNATWALIGATSGLALTGTWCGNSLEGGGWEGEPSGFDNAWNRVGQGYFGYRQGPTIAWIDSIGAKTPAYCCMALEWTRHGHATGC